MGDDPASGTDVHGRRLRIVFFNWRDTTHPEGGGSEHYVETVAAGLAALGHDVTVFCAEHPGADGVETPREESRNGFRIVRRGGKLGVYAQGLLALISGALGRPDVVVDVQNGVPFWTPLAARCPSVVLVHHVHREQWPVIYGRMAARLGWWLESRAARWVHRRSRYVTVSEVTRDELSRLGVARDRIRVIHNGTSPRPATRVARSATPHICVLGRLVPHKRVEHALRAAGRLRPQFPDLTVSIVGSGWWEDAIRRASIDLGVDDITTFHGHVDERSKHDELDRAWVLAAPSLKEGWGLVVVEAGQHGVPAVGYRYAGGLAESIVDGQTGLLADDADGFAAAIGDLLRDPELRRRLGAAATSHADGYAWPTAVAAWDEVLRGAAAGGSGASVERSVSSRRTG